MRLEDKFVITRTQGIRNKLNCYLLMFLEPQKVASIVKELLIPSSLHMTTRLVASLQRFTWNLQPRKENLSGACGSTEKYSRQVW